MKNFTNILGLAIVSIVASIGLAQVPARPSGPSGGQLRFDVNLNKGKYLPFEPVFARFRVTNLGPDYIAMERPEFVLHSSLLITDQAGKTVQTGSLSLASGRGRNMLGGTSGLSPASFFEEEVALPIDPTLNRAPGEYKFQFFFNEMSSNVISVEVTKPENLDKRACEFIAKNGGDIWFGSLLQRAGGIDALKTFVRQFDGSGYSMYANISLSKYYLYFEKNLTKAQDELSRVGNIDDPFVQREVTQLRDQLSKRASQPGRLK